MSKIKIVVLASGSGTNLQNILDACVSGKINGEVVGVVCNRKNAYALERGKAAGVASHYIGKGNYPDDLEREKTLLSVLEDARPDVIVLAGYLAILPQSIVKKYEGKIINVHPSLIPKHCGPGYYGLKVHESVIQSGDLYTGATVHYVDEGVDTGQVIVQKQIEVMCNDTAESLSKKVLSLEYELVLEVLCKWRLSEK